MTCPQHTDILGEFKTPGDSMTAPGRVILYRRDDQYEPFVTHWQNKQDGGLYHGHYFAAREAAVQNFADRVRRGF